MMPLTMVDVYKRQLQSLLLCTITSLVLGMGVALCYMYKNVYSKSFVVTLALLPVIVQAIIILVNGNLGAGVAVAGTFSLVRFRSVPGSSRAVSYTHLDVYKRQAAAPAASPVATLWGMRLSQLWACTSALRQRPAAMRFSSASGTRAR